METKTYIWIGIIIGGAIGGWLGATVDHGNYLGFWSIIISGTGSIVGVFAGYKLGNSI